MRRWLLFGRCGRSGFHRTGQRRLAGGTLVCGIAWSVEEQVPSVSPICRPQSGRRRTSRPWLGFGTSGKPLCRVARKLASVNLPRRRGAVWLWAVLARDGLATGTHFGPVPALLFPFFLRATHASPLHILHSILGIAGCFLCGKTVAQLLNFSLDVGIEFIRERTLEFF